MRVLVIGGVEGIGKATAEKYGMGEIAESAGVFTIEEILAELKAES